MSAWPDFIEGHDHDSSAVTSDQSGVLDEFLFAFFQADRIDDAHFPCTQRRPASMTLHLDESIMIGTRLISGSEAISFRKSAINCSDSSMPSSIQMSIICAPFSTCWRATSSAASRSSSSLINFRNRRRARDVGPFTHIHEIHLRGDIEGLQSAESLMDREVWVSVLGVMLSDRLGHGLDVGSVRCHSNPRRCSVVLMHAHSCMCIRHRVGIEVVFAEFIR